MRFFGVRLVGLNADVGHKLLLTLLLVAVVLLVTRLLAAAVALIFRAVYHENREKRDRSGEHRVFWTLQVRTVITVLLMAAGIISIWFDDPGRVATVVGLLSAGVAVALQRVLTSMAAYIVLLRGNVFTVGDRITMAGVRGDVVSLGLVQTTVMEMGEPPSMQPGDTTIWVKSRQYTGRIVRVTNDRIFDAPVYNYTREFPYLWEEITIPIKYSDDYARVEKMLLDIAERHTSEIGADGTKALHALRTKYFLPGHTTTDPRVYLRLTDNWIEVTIRFLVYEHGVRDVKDAMSRDILAELASAGIGIASGTYEIVGLPPVRIERVAEQDVQSPADGAR